MRKPRFFQQRKHAAAKGCTIAKLKRNSWFHTTRRRRCRWRGRGRTKKTMRNGRKNTKKRSVYHGQLNCLMEFRRRYCYSVSPEYMCVLNVCARVCMSVIFRGFLMLSVSPFRQIGILAIPSIVLLLFFNRIQWQIKIGYYRIK